MGFLTPLLTKSINSSIENNIFPDFAAALIVPLSSGKSNKTEKVLKGKPNKGRPNKNDISNFQIASILKTFLREL